MTTGINSATLTDWILTADHPPQFTGEYIASVQKMETMLRWWDGKKWSTPYSALFSEEGKRSLRRTPTAVNSQKIYYRGLRAKPRVYSIHYLRPLK